MTMNLTPEKLESIKAKIRACFNLADPTKNASEEEAATAMAMAHRLMQKYNLEEAEVLLKETPESLAAAVMRGDLETFANAYPFELLLASVIQLLCEVKPIINYRNGGKKGLSIHGLPADVAMATEVFNKLRDAVNALAGTCGYKKHTDVNRYRYGVTVTLFRRAQAMKAEAAAAAAQQCRDLVVCKQAAINEYVEKEFPNLRRGHATRQTISNATQRGMADGKRVNMDFRKKLEGGV